MRSRWSLIPITLAVATCGGTDPDRARLDRGVAWAVAELERVNTNALAAGAFREIRDQGGTLVTFVVAGVAEGADLPRFANDTPSAPWSVVLREIAGDRVVVDGFGASLDRPLVSDTVAIRP